MNLYNIATEPFIQKLHCQLCVGLVSLETDSMLLFCPLCLEIMTYSIRSLRVWFQERFTQEEALSWESLFTITHQTVERPSNHRCLLVLMLSLAKIMQPPLCVLTLYLSFNIRGWIPQTDYYKMVPPHHI